jgi:biotin carboxyl carrier protein
VKYHVTIAGRSYEVVVDGEEVLVDGTPHRALIQAVPGTPLRHLRLDAKSATLAATPGEAGQWRLIDRGEMLEVEVLDARTRHIRGLVGAGRAQDGRVQVKAPMPGLVMQVLVEPGETVVAGQGLVVLEAMKMDNELKAPAEGRVVAVAVTAGQAVEKGTLLVVVERPGDRG